MATSDCDECVLFGGVEWSSSLVTFHRNKGENVELTKSNTVATRTESSGYGVVWTDVQSHHDREEGPLVWWNRESSFGMYTSCLAVYIILCMHIP